MLIVTTSTYGQNNLLMNQKYVINCTRMSPQKYTTRNVRFEKCKIVHSQIFILTHSLSFPNLENFLHEMRCLNVISSPIYYQYVTQACECPVITVLTDPLKETSFNRVKVT